MDMVTLNDSRVLLLAIILIALFLRFLPVIVYLPNIQTLYYSVVIRHAIAVGNYFGLAPFTDLSGIAYGEQNGLIDFATIPYFLSGGLLSVGVIMDLEHIALTAISVLLVYYFAHKMTNSKQAGLFSALLFSLYPISIFFQSFNAWQGSFFVPMLIMASLYFLVRAFKESDLTLLLSSLVLIVIAYFSWNGGVVSLIIYAIAAFILMASNGTIKQRVALFAIGVIVAVSLLLAFYSFGLAENLTLTSVASSVPELLTNGVFGYYGIFPFFTYSSQNVLQFDFVAAYYEILFIEFLFVVPLTVITLIWLPRNSFYYIFAGFLAIGVLGELAFGALFSSLIVFPVAILAGSSVAVMNKKRPVKTAWLFWTVLPLFVISMAQITLSFHQGFEYTTELQAMSWIANNTAANSVILAPSQDGVDVQYYGNRATYLPAWADIPSKNMPFAQFLNDSACNMTYLEGVNANYLLQDRAWPMANASENSNYQLLNRNMSVQCDSVSLSYVYSNAAISIYQIMK